MDKTPVDIVLPVHNEGASIKQTLEEFYETARNAGYLIRFIICEDGSNDNTVAAIKAAQHLPLFLISQNERKGYSRAVIDGLNWSESDLVGFIDSDGQCDPSDFGRLYQTMLNPAIDLAVGFRNPRKDHWIRRSMSFLFGIAYRSYSRPACGTPHVLISS